MVLVVEALHHWNAELTISFYCSAAIRWGQHHHSGESSITASFCNFSSLEALSFRPAINPQSNNHHQVLKKQEKVSKALWCQGTRHTERKGECRKPLDFLPLFKKAIQLSSLRGVRIWTASTLTSQGKEYFSAWEYFITSPDMPLVELPLKYLPFLI